MAVSAAASRGLTGTGGGGGGASVLCLYCAYTGLTKATHMAAMMQAIVMNRAEAVRVWRLRFMPRLGYLGGSPPRHIMESAFFMAASTLTVGSLSNIFLSVLSEA